MKFIHFQKLKKDWGYLQKISHFKHGGKVIIPGYVESNGASSSFPRV